MCIALACGPSERADPAAEAPPADPAREAAAPPAYVGAAVCAECHPAETGRWRDSHHDRAMELPAAALAPFAGETFEHDGVVTRFERNAERPVVRTQGEDGAERAFEVAYTFGVSPLQQLLLPLSNGRLQAFRVAWDTRPRERDGARWLLLQPEEAGPPGDLMHWTGAAHRWNTQCADCHSTGVQRSFDPVTGRFDTRFAEIDVGCEACHGPGSLHAAAARAGRAGDAPPPRVLRDPHRWVFAAGEPIAQREPTRASDEALEVCAPCHARRAPLTATTDATRRFIDGYRPSLLEEGLYHADGQIRDEVYVWGSFLQSRMHAAGVRCGDCHDPHALSVPDPDASCSTCHRPEVFAAPSHHHHPRESEGASCVGCHMPARVYMEIDGRRDHSFRVPRPDLTVRIGTPNTCADCHADRDPGWASAAASRWWPELPARSHFGEAIHAGRTRTPDAAAQLLALVRNADAPPIARATALAMLRHHPTDALPAAVALGARSEEPLLRMAAVEAAESLPPRLRPAPLTPLLGDRLAIRTDAARALVPSVRGLAPGDRARQQRALEDWIAARGANADQPGSHVALGDLHRQQQRFEAAADAYETALRVAPWYVPASVNLADLRRAQGREPDAQRVLERALEHAPESAELHYALGLSHVRAGALDSALASLERAAALAPGEPLYAFVLAVAYRDGGRPDRARELLETTARGHPGNRRVLAALVEWALADGDVDAARAGAEALLARDPADPIGRAALERLPPP